MLLSSTLNGNCVTMEENLSAKISFSFLSIYEKNVTWKRDPEARGRDETETTSLDKTVSCVCIQKAKNTKCIFFMFPDRLCFAFLLGVVIMYAYCKI